MNDSRKPKKLVCKSRQAMEQRINKILKNILIVCIFGGIPILGTAGYVSVTIEKMLKADNKAKLLEALEGQHRQDKKVMVKNLKIKDISVEEGVVHIDYLDGKKEVVRIKPTEKGSDQPK